MKELKKILFPVDLSETSPKIVAHVKMMAEKFDAQIHLLFVARAFSHFSGVYVPNISIKTLEDQIAEGASKRLQEFKEQYFSDIPEIETAVLSGDISEEILNYIQDNKIDLLVMGTHGRKGLEKAFFGSVAERVIKSAPVPVYVVNPYRVT